MSMMITYDEYQRDTFSRVPVCPVPTHPLRRAMRHAFGWLGLGGVAAMDDDEALGIG